MKYRSQVDFAEQEKLNHVGTDFSDAVDMCRHELEPETDLNRVLRRYMPHELPQGETFYGERDYDLDMHDHMVTLRSLRDQALDRWASMTDDERSAWPTIGAYLADQNAPPRPEVKEDGPEVPPTAQTAATGAGTASAVPSGQPPAKA